MSTDRWRDGYQVANNFHKNRAAITDRALTEWTNPEAEKVRGLVRKHWPRLAAALDDLGESKR